MKPVVKSDVGKIVTAVGKLEGAVTGLQTSFDAKSIADVQRFDKIEATIEKHASTMALHSDLHTSHARLITKANELAIQAIEKSSAVRTEAQAALKDSLDKHAQETSAKLDMLALSGDSRAAILDKIVAWQKHPLFKAAWFIGGLIGGAVAAYFATSH
jgi:hypothetical protein